MNQRGRKSGAALAVVDDKSGLSPILPPSMLSSAERGVWLATVNSKPLDWFGTEHIPLLVEYVRHKCKADVIDGQIKAFLPEWFEDDAGLKRYDRLQSLSLKTSAALKALATSMRLTHQSIYRADKAGMGPGKGKKLWQREPS